MDSAYHKPHLSDQFAYPRTSTHCASGIQTPRQASAVFHLEQRVARQQRLVEKLAATVRPHLKLAKTCGDPSDPAEAADSSLAAVLTQFFQDFGHVGVSSGFDEDLVYERLNTLCETEVYTEFSEEEEETWPQSSLTTVRHTRRNSTAPEHVATELVQLKQNYNDLLQEKELWTDTAARVNTFLDNLEVQDVASADIADIRLRVSLASTKRAVPRPRDSFVRYLVDNPEQLERHLTGLVEEVAEHESEIEELHSTIAQLQQDKAELKTQLQSLKTIRHTPVIQRNFRKSSSATERQRTLDNVEEALTEALRRTDLLPHDFPRKEQVKNSVACVFSLVNQLGTEDVDALSLCSRLVNVYTGLRPVIASLTKIVTQEFSAKASAETETAAIAELSKFFQIDPSVTVTDVMTALKEHDERWGDGESRRRLVGKNQHLRIAQQLQKEKTEQFAKLTDVLLKGTEALGPLLRNGVDDEDECLSQMFSAEDLEFLKETGDVAVMTKVLTAIKLLLGVTTHR